MKLASIAGAIAEGFYYFSSRNTNGLFKIDLETGECNLVRFFEEQPLLQSGTHRKCIKVKDTLWFAPGPKGILNVYECNNKELKSFNCEGNTSVYYCNGQIWSIPCLGGDFLSFQDISLLFKRNKPIGYENIAPYIKCGDGLLNGFVDAQFIWMLIDNTGKICRYDTTTNHIELYGAVDKPLITISKGNEGIWLVPVYGPRVFLWDPGDGIKQTVTYDGKKDMEDVKCFRFVIDDGRHKYAFPSFANIGIQQIDNNKMTDLGLYPKDINFYDGRRSKFVNYVDTGDAIYINPANCNYLIKISESGIEYLKNKEFQNNEIEAHYAQEMLFKENILYESENLSLDRFIGALQGRYF